MIQKPYDLSLRGKTIDGNEANEVSWKISGDIQTAYKIDLLLNFDNSLVWTSNTINSYSLKHIIPVATLINGNEYKIIITVWNQGDESRISDAEIFQTSSRPVVTVDSMGVVNSFSYNFSATYTQAEGVPLRNYFVNLYDEDKNLIASSNIKTILPMEHLFSNLQTEKRYHIEFLITSSKRLTGTSGLIPFDVFYYRPKMNIQLEGKNIANAGMELSWYVSQIIMTNNNGTFISNEKLDVRGGSIVADSGFEISQDFTLKLWIESPYVSNVAEQVDLLYLSGANGTIRLQYWNDNKFHAWKEINGLKSHWSSDEVIGESFYVLLQQINQDMNLESEVNI